MNDLIQQAQQLQMEYIDFTYPLSGKESGVLFDNKELKIARPGMNLLLQLLYEYVDRKQARSLYCSSYSAFANYLNQCRDIQTSAQLWRKRQKLIAASNRGIVYGILTKYNPKRNVAVLHDIKDSGLGKNITRFRLSPIQMNVYFKHATVNGLEFGLDITNGETGHTSYSYNFYIHENKADYTFSSPNYARRKHLGKLELVEANLQAIFAEVKEVTFDYHIMHTDANDYLPLLSGKDFEKLQENIEQYKTRKLYALLGELHTLASQRGLKTVSKNALDRIYSEMMEHI